MKSSQNHAIVKRLIPPNTLPNAYSMSQQFYQLFLAVVVCMTLHVNLAISEDQTQKFTAEQIEYFESHVRPVLVERCYNCHSSDAKDLEAGLYVDSREALIQGGESGPAIVVGDPNRSLLIAAVKYEASEMPPDEKLKTSQIQALSKWVEMGAPWPNAIAAPGVPEVAHQIDWQAARNSHWAWQAVSKPEIPVANEQAIDWFVNEQYKLQANIQVATPAESHVLARRIYVDLIGIPPTIEQLQKFVAADQTDRPTAVGALVDELLMSPLYGQRWARHWLDVARYSEGQGGFLDNKKLEEAWRYRDWVVEQLNNDLPINEFIRLQIVGDLTGKITDGVATGFFALGPTYQSDGGDPESKAQAASETLDDRIDTLTRGLLGITGSCARCHDHKFDPIPQLDYYSLAGIFNNTSVRDQPLATAEVVQQFNDHQQQVKELTKQLGQIRKALKKETREASPTEQKQLEELDNQLAKLKENSPATPELSHQLSESGDRDMYVALRGNPLKTGPLAPRRFLRILAGPTPELFCHGSGRMELADAIIDPGNPLTARVFVNRVWMHHFGAGLVRTPSNFGTLGDPPTHPELLDWLASDFIAGGWSLKHLHRRILQSKTYQLSSASLRTSIAADGDNRLLWRMNPRRMDIEAWRDSLLAVTGELEVTLGGSSVEDISVSKRRTLYGKVSRNGDVFPTDGFLRRFDFPLMRATVAQRPTSIVPQQFLFLMNSEFMVQRAKAFEARLHGLAADDQAKIQRAYQLLYARPPEESEMQIGLDFLNAQNEARDSHSQAALSPWERYAQVLLSSNEFMYVR